MKKKKRHVKRCLWTIKSFKALKFELKLELKLELKWFEASERKLELKWSVE